MKIKIKYLDQEMEHFEISFECSEYKTTQDSYGYKEDFLIFGNKLANFPLNIDDRAIFESGSDQENYYCHIRIKAYVYNKSGHTALEINTKNNLMKPANAEVKFNIICEAAEINRIGHMLKIWSTSDKKEFVYESSY